MTGRDVAADAAAVEVMRFVILAHGRSGSNWLVDLLNSHPACHCHGEIFLPAFVARRPPEDPLAYLEQLMSAGKPGKTHIGFKHLPTFDHRVTRQVVADPRYRVVILTRRDRLAQYASQVIAERTDRWMQQEGEASESQPRVRFAVRDFIDFCESSERWFRPERQQLRRLGRPALEITYEALEAGEALPRVLAHLGLAPAAALHSSHRRINSADTYARFTNPGRARLFGPLIQWRPTRRLLRILRGIRPLRPLLD